MFVEVKAVDGMLTLGSSSYQIQGLIDLAANSPAGLSGGAAKPGVFFVTTSNTIIGPDIIAEASQRGVNIFQITALVNADNSIQFGPPVPLPTKPNIPLYPTTSPAMLSHYRSLDVSDPAPADVD